MSDKTARGLNPFAGPEIDRAPGAVAQTDQQRAIAEVQAAMVIARANPRNAAQAMDRILNSCTRPSLAESALYQFSRGGSDISGPSIRLAEVLAQGWGNMHYGIRELEQTPGTSTVQAFAWDVETNTRREVTFHTPHTRHTKSGSYPLTDPRDIYEHVANQGSRRLRSCILGIIPGDVIEAAVRQCEVTLRSSADTSPEGIKKMVDAFEPYGVTKDMIEARIQRRLDAIQPAQIVALKKIYASLRDGMSSPADWFSGQGGAPADAAEDRPKTLPSYPSDRFKATLPKWSAAILAGEKTADDVIAMLRTRATLSADQEQQIRACEGPAETVDEEWIDEHEGAENANS